MSDTCELVVITCGLRKRAVPSMAAQLYTGPVFTAALRWARSVAPADRMRILSAKYGLVHLTAWLTPYEQKMGTPGAVTPALVARQLPPNTHLVAVGGRGIGKFFHWRVNLAEPRCDIRSRR